MIVKKRVLTVRAHVDRRPCDLRVNERRRSHEQNSAEPHTQTSRTHLTNSLDNRHFPRFNQFSALISSSPCSCFPSPTLVPFFVVVFSPTDPSYIDFISIFRKKTRSIQLYDISSARRLISFSDCSSNPSKLSLRTQTPSVPPSVPTSGQFAKTHANSNTRRILTKQSLNDVCPDLPYDLGIVHKQLANARGKLN